MSAICPSRAHVQASTLHGVGPLSSHDVMISPMSSCICPVRLSKRMSSSMLEFEKVLFHSEYPIKLMGQEDRVMEHNTRRVMKHNLILQGAMSLMHGRKSCMGNREVSFFQRSRYLRFSVINASFIVSCSLSPFINLKMRFLLRGKGCNTLCYKILNHLH
jgi:hypothetical protein